MKRIICLLCILSFSSFSVFAQESTGRLTAKDYNLYIAGKINSKFSSEVN